MCTARTRRPSRNAHPIRRPSIRLHVDQLEVRAVPATIAWDGGPTGMGTNWLDPVNWVGDRLPRANDFVVISTTSNGNAANVILSGSVSVQQVSVAVNAALTVGGVSSGSTGQLNVQFGCINQGMLTINVGSSASGVLNGGSLTGSGVVNSDLYNSGVYENTFFVGTFLPRGTFTVNGRFFSLSPAPPFRPAGTLGIDLGGPAPGTGYDQLIVTGEVDPGRLAVNAAFDATPGQVFRIIDNRGSNAVHGTFDGLSEGGRR
jgi:fibronectin-binding autotransporter adhesin